MSDRRTILGVEVLDGRVLPSGGPILPSMGFDQVAVVQQHHGLAGHGQGLVAFVQPIPNVGASYRLYGTARLADLGLVSVHGWLTASALIQNGPAQGELTFSNEQGSVTIELTRLELSRPESPLWFHYHVKTATGAFAQLTDDGTMRLDLHGVSVGGMQPRSAFVIHI
jgi:hypothetical protein